ncbi:MAG: preprotein translocase subunit SecG [Candidatus Omnitrophica bacterium]|nr:preprotein translocase subunit SecG [Candidatus Omnitrophota bacterium]
MLTIFLVVIHVIVCLVLILVILLQAGRGQGLGGASFGMGGGVQTLFGTKAGDFLTKATSICAILFLITCISLDVIESTRARSLVSGAGAGQKPISKEDVAKIKEALEKLKQESLKEKEATAPAPQTAQVAKKAVPQATHQVQDIAQTKTSK